EHDDRLAGRALDTRDGVRADPSVAVATHAWVRDQQAPEVEREQARTLGGRAPEQLCGAVDAREDVQPRVPGRAGALEVGVETVADHQRTPGTGALRGLVEDRGLRLAGAARVPPGRVDDRGDERAVADGDAALERDGGVEVARDVLGAAVD